MGGIKMTTTAPARRLELLVVDDDNNHRALLQQELEDAGYAVVPACSGQEALELAKKHKPDMVILDIEMPELDGLDTMGMMLALYKDLAVILYTAYSTYMDEFRSWAADAYVMKSGDLTTLKETIIKVSNEKRLGVVSSAHA
jgi:CheY-like chemotaxis protein